MPRRTVRRRHRRRPMPRRQPTLRPSSTARGSRRLRRAFERGARWATRRDDCEVGDQHLSTPQRAVGSVAEAVVGDSQHRLGAAVLDHACRDVGVVMLHGDRRQVELRRPLARQVLGVHVVGDDLGHDAVQARQMIDGLQERAIGGEVFEIADVVARHHPVVLGNADRALQFGADGEHRPTRLGTAGPAARARSHANGAAPAAASAVTRTTESSQRMWIGRSCCSRPSTSGPSRAAASSSWWAIGSSLRLPLVITSGRAARCSSMWCSGLYGSIKPEFREARARHRRPARRPAGVVPARSVGGSTSVPRRRRRRGRRVVRACRARRPSPRTACRRVPFDAAARRPPTRSVASATRWYPPMPFIATIRPAVDRGDGMRRARPAR